VLSSVVPALTDRYEEMIERATGRLPLVVGPGIKTGMPIRYDNPHEVGADRIVNGVAAYAAYGGPVIVVDFGTAITLDVIDATGAYLGGAIAPGVETSAEALFARAARLAKVDLEPPATVIGTNTRQSSTGGAASRKCVGWWTALSAGYGANSAGSAGSWRPAVSRRVWHRCARRSPIWTATLRSGGCSWFTSAMCRRAVPRHVGASHARYALATFVVAER